MACASRSLSQTTHAVNINDLEVNVHMVTGQQQVVFLNGLYPCSVCRFNTKCSLVGEMYTVSTKKQEALLSQRRCAMLRVCIASIQNVERSLLLLVKLAKSHYLLLSFVCILYIVFVCLNCLFVFLTFCYHLW